LNPALVTKCITGTEQDFIMLMKKASDYIGRNFLDCNEEFALDRCTDRKGVAAFYLRIGVQL